MIKNIGKKLFITSVITGSIVSLNCNIAQADQKIGNYWVKGQIEVSYFATSGPAMWGPPITEELNDRKGGKFQKFANNASFYWNPYVNNSDAKQIGGAIRDKWGTKNWEVGPLGYPTSDETHVINKQGRIEILGPLDDWFNKPIMLGAYNNFQGGSIYWSPNTGAHIVWGLIKDKWVAQGGVKALGFPTGPETRTANGWAQNFERGRITV